MTFRLAFARFQRQFNYLSKEEAYDLYCDDARDHGDEPKPMSEWWADLMQDDNDDQGDWK